MNDTALCWVEGTQIITKAGTIKQSVIKQVNKMNIFVKNMIYI